MFANTPHPQPSNLFQWQAWPARTKVLEIKRILQMTLSRTWSSQIFRSQIPRDPMMFCKMPKLENKFHQLTSKSTNPQYSFKIRLWSKRPHLDRSQTKTEKRLQNRPYLYFPGILEKNSNRWNVEIKKEIQLIWIYYSWLLITVKAQLDQKGGRLIKILVLRSSKTSIKSLISNKITELFWEKGISNVLMNHLTQLIWRWGHLTYKIFNLAMMTPLTLVPRKKGIKMP